MPTITEKHGTVLSKLADEGVPTDDTLGRYVELATALVNTADADEDDRTFITETLKGMMKVVKDCKKAQIKQPRASKNQAVLAVPETRDLQIVKPNDLVIKPQLFDGAKPRPRAWLERFDDAIQANNWSDETVMRLFPTFLSDAAQDWYKMSVKRKISPSTKWEELRKMFEANFMGRAERRTLIKFAENMRQSPRESVSTFIPRLWRLLEQINPNLTEDEIVERIMDKLRPEFQVYLANEDPDSVEDLTQLCLRIESGLKREYEAKNFRRNVPQKNRIDRQPDKRSTEVKQVPHSPKVGPRCYNCNSFGHVSKECNKPRRESKAVHQIVEDDENTVLTINHNYSDQVGYVVGGGKNICKTVSLNGVDTETIVDTGAFYSVVNADLVQENNWSIVASGPKLCGANGVPLNCLGMTKIEVSICIGKVTKKTIHSFAVVVNLSTKCLLGLELLSKLEVQIDCSLLKLAFHPKTVKPGLRTVEKTVMPARSQMILDTTVNTVGTIVTCPFNFNSKIVTANCVSDTANNRTQVLLMNISNEEVTIDNDTQVAGFENLAERPTPTSESQINAVEELVSCGERIIVGDNLTGSQRQELLKLLNDHKDAFGHSGRLGKATTIEHDIELLPGARPFAEPLRRRPQVHIDETRRQIAEMLEQNIIQPSTSPWASAYVVVKKKSGDYRVCVDFRRLNLVTKKCAYPLPLIEDCIETLAGKEFFSTLDFSSGFWQIPMTAKARELTAFRTEDGHFEFNRMPFGLCNAPASFQRLANSLFAGLKGLDLQIFVDDICLASNGWKEHLKLIDRVLSLVEQANLTLKSSKCVFAARSVKFLGHEISKLGVRQDQDKLKAMSELRDPGDLASLRRILGLFSYYRKFVHKFAEISAPLTALTKKGVKFVWDEEQRKAFQEIKRQLMKNATLAHFDHSARTIVKTDASIQGIAGMLLQCQNNEWRVVACCSRRLNDAEQNYSITDLEGLGLVYTVCKFRHYLLGKHFEIIVDHCALCVLNAREPQTARIKRWAVLLSEFDFEVIYTKGSQHKDVDCLSRAPINDANDNLLDEKIYTITIPMDREDWTNAYNDEESSRFENLARDGKNKFQLRDGIIYIDDRLFVPANWRQSVLAEAHSSRSAGHPGVDQTLANLSGHWWPKMYEEARSFVASCKSCQLRKADKRRPSGTLQPFRYDRPGQCIAIDCLGPISRTVQGNQHVILSIDMFSRFVMAAASPDTSAAAFAAHLTERSCLMGIPDEILTDNAATFVNQVVGSICKTFGIKHIRSAPQHSRGNAVAERAIGTLQEKLSLLMKEEQGGESVWDKVLPAVVLCMNTSRNKSTGFSPFELTFGRKYFLPNALTRECELSLHEKHVELMRKTLSSDTALAQENQRSAQAKAKETFDQMHEPRIFEPGTKVLIKARARRSKLSDRFIGPYVVKSREKDIYELLDDNSNRKLTRHVSNMKEFHEGTAPILKMDRPCKPGVQQVLLALCLFQTLMSVDTSRFEPAGPTIYLPTQWRTEKEVTLLHLQLTLANPCEEIPTDRNNSLFSGKESEVTDGELATYTNLQERCNRKFDETVAKAINALAATKPAFGRSALESRAKRSIIPFTSLIWTAAMSASKLNLGRQDYGNPRELSNTPQSVEDGSLPCTHGSTEGKEINKSRQRRIVPLIVAGVTCIGVSSGVSAMTEWLDPNSGRNRAKQLELSLEEERKRIDILSTNFNVTKYILNNSISAQTNLTNDLIRLDTRIRRINQRMPQVMWYATDAQSHIRETALRLEYVSDHYRRGLFAAKDVAGILGGNVNISSIREEHTQLLDVLKIGNRTLLFEVAIREVANDTSVFEMGALDHWADLSSEPKRKTYTGSKFLVYNRTSNCARAIDQPKASALLVEETCEMENYLDWQLSSWTAVRADPREFALHNRAQVIKAPPFNYIECFYHNITLANATYSCPAYTFKLHASQAFSIGNYSYSPNLKRLELQQGSPTPIESITIQHASLAEQTSQKALLEQLWLLQNKVTDIKTVPPSQPWDREVTSVVASSSICFTIGMVVIIGGLYFFDGEEHSHTDDRRGPSPSPSVVTVNVGNHHRTIYPHCEKLEVSFEDVD